MSQTFNTNTPLTTSGSQLASQIDARSDALLTMHSGASRPSYAKQGTLWLKNDVDPRLVYFYDGSTDVLFAQVSSGGELTLSDADVARLGAANVFTEQQTIRQSGEGGQLTLAETASGKTGSLDIVAANNLVRILQNMDGAGITVYEFPTNAGTKSANAVMRKSDVDAISPLDEDDFASDSATRPPSQQSTGAYIETKTGVFGTPVASSSGTAIDFTALPAEIMEVELFFDRVSLSGTDDMLVQLGTAGGFVTSGYTSVGGFIGGASAANDTSTAGMVIRISSSTRLVSGSLRFKRYEPGGTIWVSDHNMSTGDAVATGAGRVNIGAEMTQVRVTRTGTNTFDNGEINIRYRL